MIFEPQVKGSVSRNSHPYGCKKAVENQINIVKINGKFKGSKKALIIGASSGYGLSSRIALAFGCDADTIGVSFEAPMTEKRSATAGWWNNIWFNEFAKKAGLQAKNFVGDAFSYESKKEVIKYIKEEFGGKIDLLIYSLASGRRTDPETGITYMSALKSTTGVVNSKTIDIEKQMLVPAGMGEASQEDIANTVKVMGGEDWKMWVDFLKKADVLSKNFKTVAYSYLGAKTTYPIYKDGTLGASKRDLEKKADEINLELKDINGEGFVSVNKAVVTKASAYIPLFPLYACALFKVMKDKNIHEGCIEHMDRFFRDMLYGNKREIDNVRRLRPDNLELREDVQIEVEKIMDKMNEDNFKEISDYKGFYDGFMELSGFGLDGVNYQEDINLEKIISLKY